MKYRSPTIVLCVGVFGASIWIGTQQAEDRKAENGSDAFLAADVEP